jgi:transposase
LPHLATLSGGSRDCRTLPLDVILLEQGMSQRMVNIDRQTPMLLPPDLREWVADNDLARLILEAVELCDVSSARLNVRGTGSAQYPPTMLLATLIYCYATKVFSSRQIERATYDSVAVRYLCANHHPDHDTIATFRRENGKLFERCFVQVLLMAREAGVLRVGSVSLDGTRIGGAGSISAVRRLSHIEEDLKELGKKLLSQAEEADHQDVDAGGTQLPPELADAAKRREKLLAAREHLLARREEARAAGVPDEPDRATQAQKVSVSEPESRTQRRQGASSIQGYNAQAVSDAGQSGLILGTHLCNAANDAGQIVPSLENLPEELDQPKILLVDAGYDARADIARAEQKYGVLVLCPPQARPTIRRDNARPKGGLKGRLWARRELMEARLRCPLLAAVHRRRRTTAEGVFARIKRHMGFTRLHCWGLNAAGAEWQLVCLAHNCRKLMGNLPKQGRN